MKKDFCLNDKAMLDSLSILINQCWKILPIFEGKDIKGNIVYSRDVAYEHYQKHLIFLSTKLLGASKIWQDNQYYVELVYLIEGMKDFKQDDHKQVKYIVNHCTNLINGMREAVLTDGDEVL